MLNMAESEKRNLTSREQLEFNENHNRIERLNDDITSLEKNREAELDAREAALKNHRDSNYRAPINGKNSMQKDDLKNYNLLNAIRSVASGESSMEREVSADLARKTGRQPGGLLIPMRALLNAVTVTTGDEDGAALVPVEHGSFISALR